MHVIVLHPFHPSFADQTTIHPAIIIIIALERQAKLDTGGPIGMSRPELIGLLADGTGAAEPGCGEGRLIAFISGENESLLWPLSGI